MPRSCLWRTFERSSTTTEREVSSSERTIQRALRRSRNENGRTAGDLRSDADDAVVLERPVVTSASHLHIESAWSWSPRPGESIGEYFLERQIGRGGMAEVWLARRHGQRCALKILHADLGEQADFRDMFRDESELIQSLDHPNVVRVLDRREVDDLPILAMEWVDGLDLHSLEVQLEREGGRIPLPAAYHIIRSTAAGLHAAHALRDAQGRPRGLVHRDVAPQNIMVARDGAVKLLDFGVAKARARLTQTEIGFIKGRVAYMAPEQARGLELTSRADVFALGVVFWEVVAMERLFPADGGVLEVLQRPPAPRLDQLGVTAAGAPLVVPELVADLVQQMLHMEPRARPSLPHVIRVLDQHIDPRFDFGGWCRSVLPPTRRSTAVLPAENSFGTPGSAADEEAWGPPADATVSEPVTWSQDGGHGWDATDATEAIERTEVEGDPSQGRTVVASPSLDDRTRGAPVAHAQVIGGVRTCPEETGLEPTEPFAVADAVAVVARLTQPPPSPGAGLGWVRAPVGLMNPQSFERTRSLAKTSDLYLPSAPSRPPSSRRRGPSGATHASPGWSEESWGERETTRAVPPPVRSDRRRPPTRVASHAPPRRRRGSSLVGAWVALALVEAAALAWLALYRGL